MAEAVSGSPVCTRHRRQTTSFVVVLLLPVLLLLRAATAEIWLGTSPMGWEDFDSHTNAGYNESYARKVANIQVSQLLSSGYDTFIIGGWSMGGQVLPYGSIPHYVNTSHQYTLLDEYGRREYACQAPCILRDASLSV
jgi:hypothetical protein